MHERITGKFQLREPVTQQLVKNVQFTLTKTLNINIYNFKKMNNT